MKTASIGGKLVRFGAALALLSACQGAEPSAPSKDAAGQANGPAAANAAASGAPIMDECPHAAAADKAVAATDEGACQHAEPADGKHLGAAFAVAEETPLATAVGQSAAAGETEGRVVRVSGTVESVCQKAGCWMVLQDGDVKARVFTKQNNFFLPRDLAGKRASVEGKLQLRTMSEKFAKHLEQDKGGDPSKVTGPSQELLLYASAVELL